MSLALDEFRCVGCGKASSSLDTADFGANRGDKPSAFIDCFRAVDDERWLSQGGRDSRVVDDPPSFSTHTKFTVRAAISVISLRQPLNGRLELLRTSGIG